MVTAGSSLDIASCLDDKYSREWGWLLLVLCILVCKMEILPTILGRFDEASSYRYDMTLLEDAQVGEVAVISSSLV